MVGFSLCGHGHGHDAIVAPERSRDFLDYLSAYSGLVGALLAALAILYAAVQATNARKALIQERRAEFELGLLAEIRRQMSTTGLSHLSGYVAALIRDTNDESELRVLRAAIGTKSGPLGREEYEAALAGSSKGKYDPKSVIIPLAEVEVDAAINKRLME